MKPSPPLQSLVVRLEKDLYDIQHRLLDLAITHDLDELHLLSLGITCLAFNYEKLIKVLQEKKS